MKITKIANRNHPCAFAAVNNGVLEIEQNNKKVSIKNTDDWNEFVDLGWTFPNGILCSSSIDFPEESGASQELCNIIEKGLGR